MNIWVIKVGEPLPWLDDEKHQRLWRSGQIADCLMKRGHRVTFWSSKFDHYNKTFRSDFLRASACNIKTILLSSCGYSKNLSLMRVFDHRDLAKSFIQEVTSHKKPDLIIVCWPTIELAYEVVRYSTENNVPVVLDIRDCWPDIIYRLFPRILRWLPRWMLKYEFMTKFCFQKATALTSVSNGMLTWAQERGDRSMSAQEKDFYFYQTQNEFSNTDADLKFWAKIGLDLKNPRIYRFIWAGSLEPTLDLETCLEAIQMFCRQNIKDVQFVICGKGSMSSRVRDLAECTTNLIYPGHVGEVALKTLLAHSHVGFMCYPDRFDFKISIPNKLVDFTMAGMKIITNLDYEINKVLPQTESFKYESGNARSLLHVIEKICLNKSSFINKSEVSRSVFRKDFDTKVVIPHVCDKFEELIKVYGNAQE